MIVGVGLLIGSYLGANWVLGLVGVALVLLGLFVLRPDFGTASTRSEGERSSADRRA